jgi:GAF domain-containing protein
MVAREGAETMPAQIETRADRGVEHAASSQAWLRRTLGEILAELRKLFDLAGCAFLVVDWEARHIRPAAAWFASPAVKEAFGPVLDRPYEPARAGITEAALERRAPLLIARMEDWPGAAALHERLLDQLPPAEARLTWDWYCASSLLACPVQTPGGRALGVLCLASAAPHQALGEEELRQAEVFANLAAVALDRAELLAREEQRTAEELALNHAVGEVGRSLDLEDVYRATVEQAVVLSGAAKAALTVREPATRELRVVHAVGFSDRLRRARFAVDEGMIGQVARTGEPYASREADRERFVPWVVTEEGIASFAHVPLLLGPRVFGVLTVADPDPHACGDAVLARMTAFGRAAAGAIANALDFERERRVAHALTRGFVPGPLPLLDDFEAGLVYAPAGRVAGGGDVFGLWRAPGGALALLLGDVSGKGLEVAAISAMVRFFVEARTHDTTDPARVLAETDALLRGRLPRTIFVPAVMAVLDGEEIRWCNAGHPAPVILGPDGAVRALARTALPLGLDERERPRTARAPFRPGDVLFGSTDGLIEARRDGRQFGDARLGSLLAEHGRALAPAELVERVHREAQAWAPTLDDDVVVMALRRRR